MEQVCPRCGNAFDDKRFFRLEMSRLCSVCYNQVMGAAMEKREERRAQFAGMAMQGLFNGKDYVSVPAPNNMAEIAIEYADALINALGGGSSDE